MKIYVLLGVLTSALCLGSPMMAKGTPNGGLEALYQIMPILAPVESNSLVKEKALPELLAHRRGYRHRHYRRGYGRSCRVCQRRYSCWTRCGYNYYGYYVCRRYCAPRTYCYWVRC